jgi:cytochrome c1
MRFRFIDTPFALGRGGSGIETQNLVDQTKIPIIVQKTLIRRDFGVDANPKANVPLERRRVRERIGRIAYSPVSIRGRREHETKHCKSECADKAGQRSEHSKRANKAARRSDYSNPADKAARRSDYSNPADKAARRSDYSKRADKAGQRSEHGKS